MCPIPAPNCHFGSVTEWYAVSCAHFHHKCAQLPHRIAALDPSRSGALCAVFIFIINVPHSCTELLLWIRHGVVRFSGACVVFIFIINVRRSHIELPLWIRHGVAWCSGACTVLIFSFPGCPWLPLGCSRLLPAAPGCSWLPMAAPGCLWLLLMSTVDPKKTICLGSYAGIIRTLSLMPRCLTCHIWFYGLQLPIGLIAWIR
jgi:hypothetical protein